MSRTIEVIITPQGETTITTQGFAGAECREASQPIELALGVQSSEQLTSEYYVSQIAEAQRQQRLGGR